MRPMHIVAAAIFLLNTSGAVTAQTATPNPEQVFTPIAPCRIFDSSQNTLLKGGEARDIHVNGEFVYRSQGGTPGGCAIPASATAVALSLASFGSTAKGKISSSTPGVPGSVTTMALVVGETQVTSAIIAIGNHKFVLHPSAGTTNLTADITGYFVPHIAAYISPSGAIYSSTSRVLSSTLNSTGSYAITIDRDVSYCSASINIVGGTYYGDAILSGDQVLVTTWSLSSTGSPEPQDLYFQLSVQC